MKVKHLIKNAVIASMLLITVVTSGALEPASADSAQMQYDFELLVYNYPDDDE